MIDQYGRDINYMRISITDRCNLRCRYCMPNETPFNDDNDILTYSEILRICRIAVGLGIINYKITGGEPLARKGCANLVTELKNMQGVNQVTLTTNGLLLDGALDSLIAAGVDGINISLDTTDDVMYKRLTGFAGAGFPVIQRMLHRCVENSIKVKINTVLLEETKYCITKIAMIAQNMPVDVRFIELMPIGQGALMQGVSFKEALKLLKAVFPDLQETAEKRGNGPAHYYTSQNLKGRIGFIGALSHKFCGECNRIRLTAAGKLKPCLCYNDGADIKTILRGTSSDSELSEIINSIIRAKPQAHCFCQNGGITEIGTMNSIGG